MIAGLLAVFFGWDANHGSKPRKMSLGSLLIVCENGALTSNVDQKSGSEFGSSDVFCWLLPCWKHPWTHHFSIFHHFFTVFLHLSPFLQSFLPSFLIHHLFMVSPHFHAFSCRFSWFFPTFHQKSSRLTSLFSTRGEVLRSSTAGRCAKSWAWPRGAAGCWTQGCCSCPSPGRSRRPVGCWAVLRGEGWCLRWHFSNWKIGIFPGSKADNYGKSPFSMGKSTINVPFSIAFCNRNLWDVMISPRSLPLEAMAPDEAFDDLWRFTYEKIQFSRVTLNYWRIHHFTKLVWWLKEGFKGEWWGLRGGFGDWFGIE